MATIADLPQVVVIGNDNGETVVIMCDAINRDLTSLLVDISNEPHVPIDPVQGTLWIPSPEALEERMQEQLERPSDRQAAFLNALHYFLLDLYNPEKFYRPGSLLGADTRNEQNALVHSRIVSYFRHTRQAPAAAFLRDEMFNFAYEFLIAVGE